MPGRPITPRCQAGEVPTTIRLLAEVIDYFKLGGRVWQTRIDLALRVWLKHRDTVRVAALGQPA